MSGRKGKGGEVSPLAPASSPATVVGPAAVRAIHESPLRIGQAAGSSATPLFETRSVHFSESELKLPASWKIESLSKCLEDESVSYGIVQPGVAHLRLDMNQ